MTWGTVFLKALAVLYLCAFMDVPAAHAQEARTGKEYKGTLTGAIQHHPENEKFPYWLKSGNSTYGIVLGGNARSKALLDDFRGTRISLSGTIQEFTDGGLVIVPDQPIKRPAKNPALALVRKTLSRSTTAPKYIVEEILLGNGEDVFIVGIRSKTKGYWYYWMYSVKDGVLRVIKSICEPVRDFGEAKDWMIVSTDNDHLEIVFPRNGAGGGITETWIYRNGRLFEIHAIAADGKCAGFPDHGIQCVISGSICKLLDVYWLKSRDAIYAIHPFRWDIGIEKAWLSERVGKWIDMPGEVALGNYWPTISPDPPIPGEQPFTDVSVAGKSVQYNGNQIFSSPEATSLYLQEELVLGNGDDVFIVGMVTGNNACPYRYKIFSIRNGVCTATDVFGNGDGNPIVSLLGDDAVTITFNRFNPGKGLTEAWVYKDGAVNKASAGAASRP